ncbi:hypothetical protein BDQ12DRAFT_668451 [Crucibulum laeve]|uniref:Uncharacterized protein n=1 Tax=Crucibulum laeve TaxID=68775 RepID=A0A5C3M3C5_9AGAR|nr:hypothetical protein BDQ12DRAFT_668451 [Crucibulum laeve]
MSIAQSTDGQVLAENLETQPDDDLSVEPNVIDFESTILEEQPTLISTTSTSPISQNLPDQQNAQLPSDECVIEPSAEQPTVADTRPAVEESPLSPAPALPTPTTPASPPPPLTMPSISNLPDIILHSPSSQIVGTPFATNSSRFEYPFPETSAGSSSSASSSSTPSEGGGSTTTVTVLSHFPSAASFPIFPPSTSLHALHSGSSPPSMSHVPNGLSYPPPSDLPSYTPTHPKMRAQNPPPMPPGLVKKKHRWSLGLVGRRRSSYGSEASQGSSAPSNGSIAEGHEGKRRDVRSSTLPSPGKGS